MAKYNTDGIVLKQFDLGEADKIITFYTKDEGKIRAVARNARKSKNKFSGLVLPFSYNNITFYRGRSLDRINQIENKFSFSELRQDLDKMAYASYMAEMVEKVGMEDDPLPSLFSLLLASFHKLLSAKDERLDYINLVFKIRVLSVLGFMPVLDRCVDCEKKLEIVSSNIFSIPRGGILCPACNNMDKQSWNMLVISGETLTVMNKIIATGLKLPRNLHISVGAFKELDKLVERFIDYHLDIKIKSQEFLHMIRDLG